MIRNDGYKKKYHSTCRYRILSQKYIRMEVSYEKTGAFKLETAFYLKYQKVMLRKALRYTAQMDDAEDIVSACWLSLLQRLPMLMEMKEATRYAYIMTSVRNRAIDFLRRQKSAGVLYGDYRNMEPTDPDWKRSFERIVMRDMIERLLLLLTPGERAVTLRKLCEQPEKEICAALQMTPNAVRLHWHRVKKRLRAKVEENEMNAAFMLEEKR